MFKSNSNILRNLKILLLLSFLVFSHTGCLWFQFRNDDVVETSIKPIITNDFDLYGPPPVESSNSKAIAFDTESDYGLIEKKIYELLKKNSFKELDSLADESRVNKERLKGGYWKLDAIYKALTNLYAESPGQLEMSAMWENHIKNLKKWKKQFPESVTARIALAESYINYGWFTRGTGLSNTVSKENWKLLDERLALGLNELLEARNLDTRCPRWYRVLLFIAKAQAWNWSAYNKIFEEAIKFEPAYLGFYLAKASNLQPKWHGSQREWDKFIEELPSKLESVENEEANIIYFVVVADRESRPIGMNFANLSKERIRQGFADLEKKYGVDNFRLNQFALITAYIQDYPVAKSAFDKIGDKPDKNVFFTEWLFKELKEQAKNNRFM